VTEPRTRVAVVVFADVTGEISDAHHLVERLIREHFGYDGEEHSIAMRGAAAGREFRIRVHEVMEAGMAAGNGYLWTKVTSKAFRQYPWQFDGEDDES
jgi:hypothetical protein